MGVKEKIRRAARRKKETYASISLKLGMPLQSYANRLSRGKMSFDYVERIADVLGCDVVFLDRETGEIY